MTLKILIFLLYSQSLPNLKNNEFDNNCFHIFINSLYSRDVLRKDIKFYYVNFKNPKDERLFLKKIKLKDKTFCFKKSKSFNYRNTLTINSITQVKSENFVVDFVLNHYKGCSDFGTVEIGFLEGKPIFLDAHIINSIE